MSREATNKAIVTRWMELFSEGRDEDAFRLVSDEAEWIGPFSSRFGGTYSKADTLALVRKVRAFATDGWRMWPIGFTAEGDRIAVQAESTARFRNGKTYHQQYHFLMIIADGKIQTTYEYSDSLHVAEILSEILE